MTTPKRKPLRAADDQPFDFNLDAVQAEVDLTPWRVNFGGMRWEFKHPQAIDVWDVMDRDTVSETGAMLAVFEVALGDQFAKFRKIPLPSFRLKALFEEYQRYGGVEPGESKGSTDS